MEKTTIDAIKAHMGYTEEKPQVCSKCKHAVGGEDQAGMWYYTCALNPVILFQVKEGARCKFHEAAA